MEELLKDYKILEAQTAASNAMNALVSRINELAADVHKKMGGNVMQLKDVKGAAAIVFSRYPLQYPFAIMLKEGWSIAPKDATLQMLGEVASDLKKMLIRS